MPYRGSSLRPTFDSSFAQHPVPSSARYRNSLYPGVMQTEGERCQTVSGSGIERRSKPRRRKLGTTDAIAPRGEPRRNFFFELATAERRDSWEHVVHGGGGDDGLVFVCRFVPLESLPPLAGDADLLHEL